MLETLGDIWQFRDTAVIAITTNGAVAKNGRAVFGRGVAGQAAARFTGELLALAERSGWPRVVLPRPGCGGGGLAWKDVKPLLAPVLDDRFIVIQHPVHNN
jgi:hypothetical protein